MPTHCPTMKAFNHNGRVVNVYCGLWSCKRCSKALARKWSWRVRIHVDASGPTAWFWTLTLRGKYVSAEQGFRALPKLWDNFRKIVQRRSKKWSYCAFVEGQPQRDHMPHFHIISMVKAPYRIKDLAHDAGFGFQATETKVNSGKAANYCAKYASKQSPKTPKGFRRVRASQDWAKLPEGDREPLFVKSKGEYLTDYFLRVALATETPLQNIVDRWELAQDSCKVDS